MKHLTETTPITTAPKILADTWYASHIEEKTISVDSLLQQKLPRWAYFLAKHIGVLRGISMFYLSRDFSLVVTTLAPRGTMIFLCLENIFHKGGPRVILLQFIRSRGPQNPFKRLIYPLWLKFIFNPIMQKSIKSVHVLTDWEREYYAQKYCMPLERFMFIPWPQRRADDEWPTRLDPMEKSLIVMSSGRTACDWETLFKAAKGQGWNLEVICGQEDLALVNTLNKEKRAKVFCDISREEHQKHLREAAVYVLSLKEEERSSGHVRINNAIREGTPIVATSVKGIAGYIHDGETGILVTPADARALQHAVNRLLDDANYRKILAKNAFEKAKDHTRENYLENINNLVARALSN